MIWSILYYYLLAVGAFCILVILFCAGCYLFPWWYDREKK